MKSILTMYRETNLSIKKMEEITLLCLLCVSLLTGIFAFIKTESTVNEYHYVDSIEMVRDYSQEEYDEDYSVCDVFYTYDNQQMKVSYDYEDYISLKEDFITAYRYQTNDGIYLCFDHKDVLQSELKIAYRERMADQMTPVFNLSSSLLILFLSVLLVYCFSQLFNTYEKIWFVSIMILATIFAVIFPEESVNGINGIIIMILYLLDTFLNILCELLISKQSRYNFLVSVLVEITEIVICLVLMYRFATMAVTLFFWLPIDIISYINWSKHKDDNSDELTVVRRLKGYQEILVILGILIWTIVVGYCISGLDIQSDFYHDRSLETLIAYLDACASAVGVCNGLFIFFRLREQWIAWYICAFLEAIINVLSGQYVLLILKLGYFTNTTYGYIKWSRYIKTHKEDRFSWF